MSDLQLKVDRLRAMLVEVRDRGLIYWEPNTTRGIASRSQMFADIDKVLEETSHGGDEG